MSDQFSYDVFLSHSSKDKAVVCAVAERLKADGLHVWLDEWEVRPGDHIPSKIEEGLEQSRVLVLCMSADAFGADWVQLESGVYRFRDPLNKERRFIPLRLDEAPIKGSLAQFLYINWFPADREQEYAKLLEACRPVKTQPAPEQQAARERLEEKIISLGHTDIVRSVAFSPDGRLALSGSDDQAVRLWEVESGRCLRVLEGHSDSVWSVVFSPEGGRALSGSSDKTVRLWEVESGRCLRVLEGHSARVLSVAFSPDTKGGGRALSGSEDKTVRLWEVESGRCLRVLEGHSARVWSVAFSPDTKGGGRVLSGSEDKTVRLWELESGRCLRVLEGHSARVLSVAFSPDTEAGGRALSGSADKTVRLWEVESGRCLRVLEGHSARVLSVAFSPEGGRALSGSADKTVRLWEVESGRCLRVLEGHSAGVWSVAFSPDTKEGGRALSGSEDKTVRLWEVESGRCLRVLEGHSAGVKNVDFSRDGDRALSAAWNGVVRVWEVAEAAVQASQAAEKKASRGIGGPAEQVQYTNAKVLLVGDTNAGKTGLTGRLAHDQPPLRGTSTSGTWATQWPLKDLPQKVGWEREVWLWDFGGQADQRLIHQLYLDRTALVLLMFDSDREAVLSGLREWQQALARSKAHGAPTLLVAGRTDVGRRFDREKVRAFAQEYGYDYFETSAQTGSGIPEVRAAMLNKIPWDQLTPHNSPALFKRLKDEILKLRDEGKVLVTFKELESILRLRLPAEARFGDAQLETVISLLDAASDATGSCRSGTR